jgi:cardiolipin synthase
VVVLAAPYARVVAYRLLGETRVGMRRLERVKRVRGMPPPLEKIPGLDIPDTGPQRDALYEPLVKVGTSINGYPPVGGNRGRLMQNSDAAIDEMVAGNDAATRYVYLMIYIWPKGNFLAA